MTSRPNAQDCRLRKGWYSNTGRGLGSKLRLGTMACGRTVLRCASSGVPACDFRSRYLTVRGAVRVLIYRLGDSRERVQLAVRNPLGWGCRHLVPRKSVTSL